jgi:Uma2 family endonuclease
MALAEQKKRYTQEEYLAIERKAEGKSEYFNGEVFAMGRASRKHNLISGNLFVFLHTRLKAKGCRTYASDMRVHIPGTTFYTYPDIAVVCGKEEFLDNEFDTLLNPVFLVEVLSPSTADYDIGRKFMRYRSIPSLKEYWTVSSYEYRLQKFLKNEKDTSWMLTETLDVTSEVLISSLNLFVPLSEIYDDVEVLPTNQ